MKDIEVNKIIAEFMGFSKVLVREDDGDFCMTLYKDSKLWGYASYAYTSSLDALVLVWEKLNYTPDLRHRTGKKGWVCQGKQSHLTDIYGTGDTIQQAAAQATAKAIIELKEK